MYRANLAAIILLVISLVFGYLARTAKYVWHDRTATQIFSFVAIISTTAIIVIIFIFW